jgi:hypothetical protein
LTCAASRARAQKPSPEPAAFTARDVIPAAAGRHAPGVHLVGESFRVGRLLWTVERVETHARNSDTSLDTRDQGGYDLVVESVPKEADRARRAPAPDARAARAPWVLIYVALENPSDVVAPAPVLAVADGPSAGIDLRINDAKHTQTVAATNAQARWLYDGRLLAGLDADTHPLAPREVRHWLVALEVPKQTALDRFKVLRVTDAGSHTRESVELHTAIERRSLELRERWLPKVIAALRLGDVAALRRLGTADRARAPADTAFADASAHYRELESLLGWHQLVVDHARTEVSAERAVLHLEVASPCRYSAWFYRDCLRSPVSESFGAGVDLSFDLHDGQAFLAAIDVMLPSRFVEERSQANAVMRRYGAGCSIERLGCGQVLVVTASKSESPLANDQRQLLLRGPRLEVACDVPYGPVIPDAPARESCLESAEPCERDALRDLRRNGEALAWAASYRGHLASRLRACVQQSPRPLAIAGEFQFGPPRTDKDRAGGVGGAVIAATQRGLAAVAACITPLLEYGFQNATVAYEVSLDAQKPTSVRVRGQSSGDDSASLPARWLIDSEPWADIRVDGRAYGRTPLGYTGVLLAPGRHQIELVTAAGAKRSYAIDLEPGDLLFQDVLWEESR